MMNPAMTKTLRAAALATALGVASMSANAIVFPDFQVTPTLGGGPLGPVAAFTADKMTGNYVEWITLTSATTFDVSIKWQAGQFVADDGTNPLTGLQSGLTVDYGLYALFQGSGTFSTAGVVTTFNLNSGNLDLYIDPSTNTTFTNPVAAEGSNPWTTTGTTGSDDLLLGSGAAISGLGTLDPGLGTCIGGINCGSFGQTTAFGLTSPNGVGFFTSPIPFYNLTFESGQLNNFTLSGTQKINGSLDAVFGQSVPEPATLALLGVGLLGLGMSRRGRKQA